MSRFCRRGGIFSILRPLSCLREAGHRERACTGGRKCTRRTQQYSVQLEKAAGEKRQGCVSRWELLASLLLLQQPAVHILARLQQTWNAGQGRQAVAASWTRGNTAQPSQLQLQLHQNQKKWMLLWILLVLMYYNYRKKAFAEIFCILSWIDMWQC